MTTQLVVKSKTKAATPNKAFSDNNGNWYNCTQEIWDKVNSKDTVSFQFSEENGRKTVIGDVNVVTKAPPYQGGRGGQQGGGKKPFTDNSVGMAVGMCMNNAVNLYAEGKIQEDAIPVAMANMYRLTEYAKKMGAQDGNIDAITCVGSFSFSKAIPAPAQQVAPAAQAAPVQQQAPAQPPAGYDDFDDDIPF